MLLTGTAADPVSDSGRRRQFRLFSGLGTDSRLLYNDFVNKV